MRMRWPYKDGKHMPMPLLHYMMIPFDHQHRRTLVHFLAPDLTIMPYPPCAVGSTPTSQRGEISTQVHRIPPFLPPSKLWLM